MSFAVVILALNKDKLIFHLGGILRRCNFILSTRTRARKKRDTNSVTVYIEVLRKKFLYLINFSSGKRSLL